jgi:pimeloyl-ACP methyl ester carboxylesterase
MKMSWILVAILTFLLALVVLPYIVEALRPAPKRPEILLWAPRIPIDYADLGGIRVRCIKAGVGPNLVLLHTLRTQLDMFEKIIPELEEHFTVHAFDYPGHGWSDIPKAAYAPEDFYQWTVAYLDKLDIARAAVVGVSIGGTLSLMLAARQNPRVTRIIAVNPYDYWPAGGIRKSSLAARLVFTPSEVPVLGATIMRLRNRYVSDRIFEGGLASPKALPKELAEELYKVGVDRVITGVSWLTNACGRKPATSTRASRCPCCSCMASMTGRRSWKGSAHAYSFRALRPRLCVMAVTSCHSIVRENCRI